MAELADALDLGSSAARRVGSSPTTRTTKKARFGVLFSMKFVPYGTSEILPRNVKYTSRMKYASHIKERILFHIRHKPNIS